MFEEIMKSCKGPSRRKFMEHAAKACLGVSAMPLITRNVIAAPTAKSGKKVKNIIYLFMSGAMTHLDTFDLKPGKKNKAKPRESKPMFPACSLALSCLA